MRRHLRSATLLVLALAALSGPARAQGAGSAALGGAAGLVAGGYVAVGIWTAKAHWFDDYLYSTRDALGWEATPVLLGLGTGVGVGLADDDRLGNMLLGGSAGFLAGTGVGLLLGSLAWPYPEGRWAGAVIGGGAGILVGSIVGLAWSDDDDPAGPAAAAVPIGVTIRF